MITAQQQPQREQYSTARSTHTHAQNILTKHAHTPIITGRRDGCLLTRKRTTGWTRSSGTTDRAFLSPPVTDQRTGAGGGGGGGTFRSGSGSSSNHNDKYLSK
jgi:hypothetical protein